MAKKKQITFTRGAFLGKKEDGSPIGHKRGDVASIDEPVANYLIHCKKAVEGKVKIDAKEGAAE